MKIIRFSQRGRSRWGVMGEGETILVLAIGEFARYPTLREFIEADGLDIARETLEKNTGETVGLSEVRVLSPATPGCTIVCVGKNYQDHAKETGSKAPEQPLFFSKASSALSGPFDPIRKPAPVLLLDYEVELAVVIGKTASNVSEENAIDHVAGYTVINDVSSRDYQNRDRQWFRAKSMDTFAPCGPWLVTKDEAGDPSALNLTLTVNGELRQRGNTRDLIHPIPKLLADLTQTITLHPGDVLATGTPAGVAMGYLATLPKDVADGKWDEIKDTPEVQTALAKYLHPGMVVESTIERIGTMRNTVVAERAPSQGN